MRFKVQQDSREGATVGKDKEKGLVSRKERWKRLARDRMSNEVNGGKY